MLEKLLEIAASKTLDVLVTFITSKTNEKRRIQHKLQYNKSGTLRAIETHLQQVGDWSSSVDILGMPRPKNLDDIYINLSLTDDPRRLRLGNVSQVNLNYSIQDALGTGRHLLVLGDPGSGKTTTQKKIAHDLLKQRKHGTSSRLPIVIRLRDMKGTSSLEATLLDIFDIDFVKKQVQTIDDEKEQEQKGFELAKKRALCAFLDELNVLLLLDGYDELSPDLKTSIFREVESLAPLLRKCKMTITSRSADFVRKPENFLVFEIQSLSEQQIESFVGLWFSSDNQRRRTAEDFLETLQATPYKDLSTRPLTLANLCLVFEKYGSFPELPVSVYRKTINLLLEEWDAERGIHRKSRYSLFDAHRKMDFLAAFAYHLVVDNHNALSFGTQDFVKLYRKIHNRFRLPANEALATALEIESHTGIIVKSSYETFEFSHKSLQEFLVAEHLVRLKDIPSAVALLRSCPNELAISVALSSDATDWFCGLFRDKINRVTPKAEWILPFLYRVSLERPTFEMSAELGGTVLWILSTVPGLAMVKSGGSFTDERLSRFLRTDAIQGAVKSFLTYCTTEELNDEALVRLRTPFNAKYPVPMELKLKKIFLSNTSDTA